MAADKKSFVLYCDLIHTVEGLSDKEAGKLFKHVLAYVNDKNPETTDKIVNVAFTPIKQQLKRDLVKYEIRRLKNVDNAKMRWHAIASERIKSDAKNAVTENGTVNVNDTVTIKKERRVFAPPVLEEVVAYMTEQNGKSPDIEAKKFINHYSSNGWMVGKNKMKNWRGAVGGWILRNTEIEKNAKLGTSEARNNAARNF